MSATPSSTTMSLHNLSRRITFRHIAIIAFSSILLFTFYTFADWPSSRPSMLDDNGSQRPLPPHAPRPPRPPANQDSKTSQPNSEWAQRAQEVKEAFLYAYRGYEKYAAPHDELLPVNGSYIDKCVTKPLTFMKHTHLLLASMGGQSQGTIPLVPCC